MNLLSILSAPDTLGFVLRVLLACICGGAIGFERTKRLKEAGIRTHCIIASAAALIMVLSKYGFSDMEAAVGEFYSGMRGADPARIAAQIVSGISFLGAGVIFRNGNSVKGLTTAAGIWATSAVGMSIGSGLIVLGLTETALIVIIQILFHRFSIGNDAYSDNDVRIVATDSEEFRQFFSRLVETKRVQMNSVRMERQGDGTVVYHFSIRTRSNFSLDRALELFHNNPDIHSISM